MENSDLLTFDEIPSERFYTAFSLICFKISDEQYIDLNNLRIEQVNNMFSSQRTRKIISKTIVSPEQLAFVVDIISHEPVY